jgi:hypothetical protein
VWRGRSRCSDDLGTFEVLTGPTRLSSVGHAWESRCCTACSMQTPHEDGSATFRARSGYRVAFTRAEQVCQIGREKDLEIVQAGIYKRQAIRTFRRNPKGYHVRLFPNPDRCHGRAHAAARAYLLRMHGSASPSYAWFGMYFRGAKHLMTGNNADISVLHLLPRR